MANKKYLESKIKMEQEKEYLNKRKKLRLFPLAALLLAVVLLLFMLSNWAAIHNTAMNNGDGGYEIKVSGYNCVSAGISGEYTDMDTSRFGDMAVFNYHIPAYIQKLCTLSVVVLFVVIVHLIVNLFALITNKQGAFNVVGIAFAVAEAALFIACYAVGISFNHAGILHTYCNDNPACSVQSNAILPALFAIISISAPVLAMIYSKKIAPPEEAPAPASPKTGKRK